MSIDHRQSAQARIQELVTLLRTDGGDEGVARLIEECEALARAIAAFHMEGIRFRMYNVDLLLARGQVPVPLSAPSLFSEARRNLEAAGFHTRSHHAPG
jgi:hypothetical protein